MICRLIPGRRPMAGILKASEFMCELVEHHRQVTEHELVLGVICYRRRQPVMSCSPAEVSRRGRPPPIRFDSRFARIQ
jgi:hypothetical protein